MDYPEPTNSVGRKVINGIISGAGLTFVNITVAIVQIRLILQFLPQNIAGIWFLFLSIGLYIGFLDLGISPTISREIGFILGDTDKNENHRRFEIGELIATCLRVFQILSGLVLILGFILGSLFLLTISPIDVRHDVIVAWGIFAFGASLNILGGGSFAALYGMGNIATERVIRIFCQALWLMLVIVCLNAGFGLIGLAVVWVVPNLLARLLGWLALQWYYPWLREQKYRPRMSIVKKIAVPSLKWAAMSLGALMILQTDNVIIATKLGPGEIPPYEAILKIISTLMTFSLLIVTSSTPFLSKMHAHGDIKGFKQLLLRNVKFGMSLMLILSVFFAVFADNVVNLWLGHGNFVGFPIVWLLLVMLFFEVHHVIHASATMAAGHIVFLKSAIGAGILKIGLSVWLAGEYGLFGVAMGTLIAQALTNNWYAPFVAFKLFQLSVLKYLHEVVLPLTLTGLFLIAIGIIVKSLFGGASDLVTVIMGSSVIGGGGILLCFGLLMTDEERKLVFARLPLKFLSQRNGRE